MTENNERVKRHRVKRKLIRVEVEVPTPEDAAEIRRYAQSRRCAPGAQREPSARPIVAKIIETPPLEALLSSLAPEALDALHMFASALARATSDDLLARGSRVAANFHDATAAAARTAAIKP